jgi:AAA family ATP:ADP antiporter
VYYGYVFDWNQDDIASAQLISLMVLWGGVQSILGKSCRALFDTTKEMAFIPLNEPIKSVSKAFEVMVMRFAEAGGALVQLIMLSFIDGSSIISLAPNILFIFLIFMAVWILSTIALSSEFNNKVY